MLFLNSVKQCLYNLVLKRTFSSKHDLFASVILQRLPLVAPPMNVIEKTLSRVTEHYEIERSLHSDHEMKHTRDVERLKMIASKKALDEAEMEASTQQTAVELDDLWRKELSQFSASSVITDDDKCDNKRSLNRHLDKNLLFVCNVKNYQKDRWGLPRIQHRSGETLKQTAERLLMSLNNNPNFNTRIMGNCPCAVFNYNYPKSHRQDKVGAKVFFFKAELLKGEVDLKNCDPHVMSDYSWLTRNECESLFPKRYWKSIKNSLFLEELESETVARVIMKIKKRLRQSGDKSKVSMVN